MTHQVAQGKQCFPPSLPLGQDIRGQTTPIATKPMLQMARLVYPCFTSLIENLTKCKRLKCEQSGWQRCTVDEEADGGTMSMHGAIGRHWRQGDEAAVGDVA